eukprot:CAMPEP_0172171794 /NCGR_PEP_ID=MMETSP1050-20130122/12091_1 /TAXON_ID=233186 /ORGANISM="Cryptomonas curvata, Strain CCAP979/52" /LENGTH=96 /DNA_ID=CAMNT_0012843267 /DNA_START=300 /DNA_END=590 /DNA_ORIENTATION=+
MDPDDPPRSLSQLRPAPYPQVQQRGCLGTARPPRHAAPRPGPQRAAVRPRGAAYTPSPPLLRPYPHLAAPTAGRIRICSILPLSSCCNDFFDPVDR